MWTSRQRDVALVFLVGLIALLGWRLWRNPDYVPTELPPEGGRAIELTGRLDPNTASAVELSALPAIGPTRARLIVEHREQFARENGGRRAFERLEDMSQIKGIGPGSLRAMEPFLVFGP